MTKVSVSDGTHRNANCRQLPTFPVGILIARKVYNSESPYKRPLQVVQLTHMCSMLKGVLAGLCCEPTACWRAHNLPLEPCEVVCEDPAARAQNTLQLGFTTCTIGPQRNTHECRPQGVLASVCPAPQAHMLPMRDSRLVQVVFLDSFKTWCRRAVAKSATLVASTVPMRALPAKRVRSGASQRQSDKTCVCHAEWGVTSLLQETICAWPAYKEALLPSLAVESVCPAP